MFWIFFSERWQSTPFQIFQRLTAGQFLTRPAAAFFPRIYKSSCPRSENLDRLIMYRLRFVRMRVLPVSAPPAVEITRVRPRAASWYPACSAPVRVIPTLTSHGVVSFRPARAGKISHKLKHVNGLLTSQGVRSRSKQIQARARHAHTFK